MVVSNCRFQGDTAGFPIFSGQLSANRSRGAAVSTGLTFPSTARRGSICPPHSGAIDRQQLTIGVVASWGTSVGKKLRGNPLPACIPGVQVCVSQTSLVGPDSLKCFGRDSQLALPRRSLVHWSPSIQTTSLNLNYRGSRDVGNSRIPLCTLAFLGKTKESKVPGTRDWPTRRTAGCHWPQVGLRGNAGEFRESPKPGLAASRGRALSASETACAHTTKPSPNPLSLTPFQHQHRSSSRWAGDRQRLGESQIQLMVVEQILFTLSTRSRAQLNVGRTWVSCLHCSG
jgi:hypothetical protein